MRLIGLGVTARFTVRTGCIARRIERGTNKRLKKPINDHSAPATRTLRIKSPTSSSRTWKRRSVRGRPMPRPVPSDVRRCDGWCLLVLSTTWPFAPDLLRDDTSVGTRPVLDVSRLGLRSGSRGSWRERTSLAWQSLGRALGQYSTHLIQGASDQLAVGVVASASDVLRASQGTRERGSRHQVAGDRRLCTGAQAHVGSSCGVSVAVKSTETVDLTELAVERAG
jgi:hypothetical protein